MYDMLDEKPSKPVFIPFIKGLAKVLVFLLGAGLIGSGIYILKQIIQPLLDLVRNAEGTLPELITQIGARFQIAPLMIQEQAIDLSLLFGVILFAVCACVLTFISVQLIFTGGRLILNSLVGAPHSAKVQPQNCPPPAHERTENYPASGGTQASDDS